MNNFKNIIFTGGGSGGHVIPAITIIESLEIKRKLNIFYVGGISSVERELISKKNIPYKSIYTGKLRRYFSVENMMDFFKFLMGVAQSFFYLLKFKRQNTLIFSTGGFVGLPLVIAAGVLRFKVYIHEQTSRVGLANKIASIFATKIFISFEESKKFFPAEKTIFSGYPLKANCFLGKNNNFEFEGFKLSEIDRPIFLITGGGNGSKLLNDFINQQIDQIKDEFFIIHQVGQKFINDFIPKKDKYYHPVAFLDNMVELMKFSEIIISRSGAGTVMELLALNKVSIFVPLKIAQKNEQFYNALEAKNKIGSIILTEDEFLNFNITELVKNIRNQNREHKAFNVQNGVEVIIAEI